jgi:hypothetical protein
MSVIEGVGSSAKKILSQKVSIKPKPLNISNEVLSTNDSKATSNLLSGAKI